MVYLFGKGRWGWEPFGELTEELKADHHIVIGDGVELGEDVRLGDHVVIRDRAHIGRCVELGEAVLVGEGAHIGDDTVFEERCRIGPFSSMGSRCTVYCMAQIGGWVSVGKQVFIGVQAMIMDKALIRDAACIGDSCHIGLAAEVGRAASVGQRALLGDHCHIGVEKIVPQGFEVPRLMDFSLPDGVMVSVLGSGYPLFYHGGEITIGCQRHDVDTWLRKGAEIAERYNFHAVEEYRLYVSALKVLDKGLKRLEEEQHDKAD
jgi:acyl-[acyl carrier protein]--UDP-N-acetylglucosamine O-acyltransferase